MAKKPTPKLAETAETIGTALGHLAGRLSAWKTDRPDIAGKLHELMKTAQDMLGRHEAASSPATTTRKKAPVPPASADTRVRARVAWRKGEADSPKAPAEHTKSGDSRAEIRATDGRRFTNRQTAKR